MTTTTLSPAPTPSAEPDFAPTPLQEMVLEVLAGRLRTGETLWTLPTRVRAAAAALENAGLLTLTHGITAGTFRASLTEAGIGASCGRSYRSPILELHQSHANGACLECSQPWPCRTAVLSDPALADPGRPAAGSAPAGADTQHPHVSIVEDGVDGNIAIVAGVLKGKTATIVLTPAQMPSVLRQLTNHVLTSLEHVARQLAAGSCATCANTGLVETLRHGRPSNEYCPDCTAARSGKAFASYPTIGAGD